DDAQAYLLFRNHASLFDVFEGLAELRLILHLMPTQHMDDTLAIKQIEAKAFRIPPLPPPPRPFGPRASWPLLGLSGAVGTHRHIGSIDAQHHHRTAKATSGHRGDAPLDLLARWRHIQHCQALGHLVSHGVHSFAPKRHARQIVNERLGRVIGDFGDQIYRGLVHIELFASRHQTQGVVKGVETRTTSAATEIGALQLHRPHHRLDRAPDLILRLEHTRTPRTAGLLALAFTLVGILDDRL